MAANVNVVAIVGNLTRDPELRSTGSGTSVATLGVACNSREKHGEEWTDYASFFDVTVWGRQAEACAEHLHKGSPVAVNGKLRQERWEKDGNARSKVIIVARDVQFLPSRKQQSGGGEGGGFTPSGDAPAPGGTDDIPF